MVNLIRHLKPIVAAFVLAMGIFQPSVAVPQGQDAASGETAGDSGAASTPRVAEMMQQLQQATPEEAGVLAEKIRREWDSSGSAPIDFLMERGRKALEVGDTDGALQHLSAVVDHAPNYAQGWAERARVFFELDAYGLAIGDLEHVLALNPQHFDALMGLAILLDSMERPVDAYEAYMQVKAIHPNQVGLTEAIERLEPQVRGRKL